eukprot:398-Heterococcus_DN1.PRE.1
MGRGSTAVQLRAEIKAAEEASKPPPLPRGLTHSEEQELRRQTKQLKQSIKAMEQRVEELKQQEQA